ncbi:protein kinase family protein [uncultured Draconibacterium sp.]|uniref:protein kinase family protein n=1 Tax=uncultured Draconibacterium sp. TaxID=1573823 RepID=UPI0029C818CD|nr:protein kinase family protein [uncultured Draconibacterium sp.]
MFYDNRRVRLSINTDGHPENEENIILYDDKSFQILPLTSNYTNSKGGNSSVFKLISDDGEEFAIKFSNYFRPIRKTDVGKSKGYYRFLNEINALLEARDHEFQNIIRLIFEDAMIINGKEFPFYVMEKADTDLKEYLLENPMVDNQQRFLLCRDLFKAIKQLHSIDIYHRDIKPDNILLFLTEDKFSWKIGDLGLIKYRENDFDDIGDRIGPFGWISPEAMNKVLTEKANIGLDCSIDEYSDIYMLGEVFWFVFMNNVPIGQIQRSDFSIEFPESDLYFDLVSSMLSYSKNRRVSLNDIDAFINHIGKALYV